LLPGCTICRGMRMSWNAFICQLWHKLVRVACP
jgi:hypothetical protein